MKTRRRKTDWQRRRGGHQNGAGNWAGGVAPAQVEGSTALSKRHQTSNVHCGAAAAGRHYSPYENRGVGDAALTRRHHARADRRRRHALNWRDAAMMRRLLVQGELPVLLARRHCNSRASTVRRA